MRNALNAHRWDKFLLFGILFSLAGLGLAAFLAPAERTLGLNIRLVYFHGAWVWAGLILFLLAALAGLAGLALRQAGVQRASLMLGRTALLYWLTYLPMSLLVMQVTWGGFFFSEPRWRIPLMIAVAETVLQIALVLLDSLPLAAGANLLFGVGIWAVLLPAGSVLHPDSPVFGSGSVSIQVRFVLMVSLALAAGLLLAAWLWRRRSKSREAG